MEMRVFFFHIDSNLLTCDRTLAEYEGKLQLAMEKSLHVPYKPQHCILSNVTSSTLDISDPTNKYKS